MESKPYFDHSTTGHSATGWWSSNVVDLKPHLSTSMQLFYHFRHLRSWPIQKVTEDRSTQTERIEIGTVDNGVSKLATDNSPIERNQKNVIPTADASRMELLARNNPTAVYNYREIAQSRLPPPDHMDVSNQLIYRALLKFFTEEEKKRTYFHYYNVRTELLKKEQFGIDYKSLHSLIEGNIKWIGDTLQVHTAYGEWKMTRSQIERGRASHTQHYGFQCEWNENFFARMIKAILAHECIDCICTASWLCDATALIKSLGSGTTRFIASCHHRIILDGDDSTGPAGEMKETGKKFTGLDNEKESAKKLTATECDKKEPVKKLAAMDCDKKEPVKKLAAKECDKKEPVKKLAAMDCDKKEPVKKLAAMECDKKEPVKKLAATECEKKQKRQKLQDDKKPDDSSLVMSPNYCMLPPRMWEESGPGC